MSETWKVAIAIVSSICGGGILVGLFKFIIIAYFKNQNSTIDELIGKKNDHELKINDLENKFDNLDEDFKELKGEHKENH
jgi:hypothetical protein